jgi:hypothetical protein
MIRFLLELVVVVILFCKDVAGYAFLYHPTSATKNPMMMVVTDGIESGGVGRRSFVSTTAGTAAAFLLVGGVAPTSALVGPVKIPLSNPTYSAQPCPKDKVSFLFARPSLQGVVLHSRVTNVF